MRRYALTIAAATALTALGAPIAAAADGQLPPLTVLTNAAGTGRGDIFIAPTSGAGQYANGVEILSPDGRNVVWSRTLPSGLAAADFRKQTYRGKPVLTWWQGTGLGGLAADVDEIYDARYRKVGEVRAGNGYQADGHEFVITPRDTALILARRRPCRG